MCDMNHPWIRSHQGMTRVMCVTVFVCHCEMTRLGVLYDSFVCVSVFEITRLCVLNDSFVCAGVT